MSTDSSTQTDIGSDPEINWFASGISGILAGIVFGAMIQMMMTPVMTKAIPALYGQTGATTGWLLHILHSLILGMVYAGVVTLDPIADYASDWSTGIGTGLGYGLLLWILFAVIVMPIWLSTVGFPGAPGVPNISPKSLMGHLVYGLILGAVYPLFDNQLS